MKTIYNDLVSVIIPYYKKKSYVKKTIDSILNQSHQNFEIILIYDDESYFDLEFIKEICQIDTRINLITNEKSFGAGLSRNKGIQLAKGEYIAFIDSDDTWHEKKLEKQINFMKKNDLLCSHTSYEIIDNNDIKIGIRRARNFNETKELLKSCDIGLSTVMVSKKIFINQLYFAPLKTKEDFVLWLKILEKNITIASIDEFLTSWRKLENSLSSSTIQKLFDAYTVYHKYMRFNFLKSLYYVMCLSINYLRK